MRRLGSGRATERQTVGRTTMTKIDFNKVLRTYLGAGSSGGVLPYGQEERIRSEYGTDADEILAEVRQLLTLVVIPRDLELRGSLPEIAAYAEQLVRSQRPDLEALICRAVGNYVSYSYR
jgi:hypothetical protein